MSKDIRLYFAVKSSPTSQKKGTSDQGPAKRPGQRKRPVILIDSDSDDDSNFTTSKRSKSSEVKDKKSTSEKVDSKVVSKYFPEKVNASDVFGGRPVKRDNSRNIVKKVVTKETLEFHIDKEFEEELARLDGIDQPELDCAEHKNQLGSHNKEGNDQIFKDKVEIKNGKVKIDHGLELFASDEVQRKKIKLEDKSKSPNEKHIFTESKEKNKINPFKEESPSTKSPTIANNSVQKDCTSEFFSTNTSPSKSSCIKNKSLFPDLSPDSFPEKESLTNSNSQKSQKSINFRRKDEIENTNKNCKKGSIVQNGNVSPSTVKIIKNEVPSSSSSPCNLWVEKYKPSTSKQIIGQQGEKSCVNKLTFWLKNWHKNHSGSKKLVKPSPWAKNDDGAYFKAALLSGPPGIGKTTTAHLVSKELGFDVVEFNASDTRSKKLLHQEVSELLSTNSLSTFFSGQCEQVTKNHVLLMDEVDGMAGNEDRGGVQELIQLIKTSRVPIICMCNDRNHPKIRSLANYCFDLRFTKPRAEQIKGAMMSVCFKEKLKISPTDITEIITSANQDIRLIINHLSMLSIEKSSLSNSSKHIKLGPWDITRKIFSEEEHKKMSINDKCDLFFHDYNATPLFVQENYLNAVSHKPEGKNKIKKMELFARAARSLSLGDLTEKSIRSNNAWGLLPVQAVFSSLVPGDILEGHIGAQINFPAWFGKNSRQTKLSRLLQELTVHTRLKISGNKEAMNLDYLMPLERSILMPLVTLGTEGVPEALAVLNEYCLVRDDIESFTELSSWPNSKNLFAQVESKVKAAFTREYKKSCPPPPYAPVAIKKVSKSDTDSMDIDEEDEASQELEDEEEDDLEFDSMIVVKKKPAAKKDAPSTSKGSKKGNRGRKK